MKLMINKPSMCLHPRTLIHSWNSIEIKIVHMINEHHLIVD